MLNFINIKPLQTNEVQHSFSLTISDYLAKRPRGICITGSETLFEEKKYYYHISFYEKNYPYKKPNSQF